MPLVTFQADVFPYCRGDVVNLSADEKKRVDAVVKGRNLDGAAYVSGDKRSDIVDSVDDPRELSERRFNASRDAAKLNAVDQAAQLEAQRAAVAEPANVDALGVGQEVPAQVVTGTAPAADVEVSNPQEATDISSGEGVDAKVKRSRK